MKNFYQDAIRLGKEGIVSWNRIWSRRFIIYINKDLDNSEYTFDIQDEKNNEKFFDSSEHKIVFKNFPDAVDAAEKWANENLPLEN